MLKVIDLKTEYITDAIGIECKKPKFSWRFETDIKNFFQTSYRIIVSDTIDLLNQNKGNMWDSKTVKNSKQIAVHYKGKKLKSRGIYYWKVIITGNEERAESCISNFEMGITDTTEWKGFFVSTPTSFVGSALYFRKAFTVPKDKKVTKARIYVCGLGYNEVYLNGNKLGLNILDPAVSNYSKSIFYNVYKANEFLQNDNVIGVIVGHGWYGSRKLLLQIYIDFSDGSYMEIHTANCDGWWATGSPIINDSIYDGEIYDARREKLLKGWSTTKYIPGWNNGWLYTFLIESPKGKLKSQIINPIKVMGEYKPVAVKKLSDNIFIYDMGQVFSGWAKIKVKGEQDAKISLKYAEGLKEDGTVNQLNLRSAKCRDLYILNGEGEEEYNPRFTYHGFGFVQAEIEGNAEIIEITGQYVRSSVEKIGDFNCSDNILNKLHNNALITEGSNLHSIMTDCPQRDERLGWINDLTSRIYQSVYNYGMERFFPKVVDDIADTQDDSGAIGDTAPFYTGGRPADPVSISFLLIGLLCYRRYGDLSVLQKHYNDYKKWVKLLEKMSDKNNLLSYSPYGDWCPPGNFQPDEPPFNKNISGVFISTAYYYWHMECMNEIALLLRKKVDANIFKSKKEKIRKSFIKHFYNKDLNTYGSGSQSCNSIVLNLNIDKTNNQKTASNIAKDIIDKEYHHTTGNQAYRHLFEGLTKYGYQETLYKMLINPEYPGWGYMIAKGATSVWERWEDEMQNTMHSFCHPMFASYDVWFYASLAGISFDNNCVADDKVIISPVTLQNLKYCSGKVFTLRGEISCKWKKEDDFITYQIILPPNTYAKMRLKGKIIESNIPKNIKTEFINGKSCLNTGSGSYKIKCKG